MFPNDLKLVSNIAHLWGQSFHIFPFDQQLVSDIEHLGKPVSSLFSYDKQQVSDIEHFVDVSLITFSLMTNRE
jgi:hypothetical protein